LIEIAKIQKAAETLRDATSFLGSFEGLDEEIPVIKTTVNKLIAGNDRTIADLFDFTSWADSLEGTATASNTSPDMIAVSELLYEMRKALSSVMKPDLPSTKLPPVPDPNNFEIPPVLANNNCNGNNKAISLDISESSGALEITICTFLEFELEGELTADGLLAEIAEDISLKLDAGFVLKGAFSTGIKITVASLTDTPTLELDPVLTQLYLQTDLSGSARLGLISATISGAASLLGQFSFGYCSSCNGAYPHDGYEQAGEGSSFYLKRLIGYDLDGKLAIALEAQSFMPSLDLGIGAEIGISDENVFDDISPVVELPTAKFLVDAMKFSPRNAVSELSNEHI
jgi:hypothetical protein